MNEERKHASVQRRIEALLEKRSALCETDVNRTESEIDRFIEELELTERDLTQTIVHVDMDGIMYIHHSVYQPNLAFYASVEELDCPELKSKPMAVGGISMLSTANYEARKYGVRSAMPGYIALKLCPDLVIVPCHFDRYRQVAEQVRSVLEKYDRNVDAAGLDESYLNITEYLISSGIDAETVVKQMRLDIENATQLTASAGIAANTRLAKICSDLNKPNGQYRLENDRNCILKFLYDLPIRKINGIGRVTEQMLQALNIKTCGDVIQYRGELKLLLSEKMFDFILHAALGIGSTKVNVEWTRKSMSNERTFHSTSDKSEITSTLRYLCESLAKEMAEERIKGRNVSVKLKRSDFHVLSRAKSLPRCIFSAEDLYTHALSLLELEFPISLRLLGVRISHLQSLDDAELPDIAEVRPSSVTLDSSNTCVDVHFKG